MSLPRDKDEQPALAGQRGFTLVEMLTALGIFLLITGAAFTLLSSSQQRYQTESQVLSSFQEARLGLDQMVRDINDAGFPPPTYLNYPNSIPNNYLAITPFAWSANANKAYPNPVGCQIGTAGGGTCTGVTDSVPGDFDIIIEANPTYNPTDPLSQVQWIRYQLQGTTLFRGTVPKASGAGSDPDTAFAGQNALVPFVQNVVNNSPGLQVGVDGSGNPITLSTEYPGVFAAGAAVPIFQYICDTPSVSQALPLPTALCINPPYPSDNSPTNIRDVVITLIVKAPLPDATTGRVRLVQLEGRGRRINPNQ